MKYKKLRQKVVSMAVSGKDLEPSFSFSDGSEEERISKVLVLYAGGTIGMKKTANGKHLEQQLIDVEILL